MKFINDYKNHINQLNLRNTRSNSKLLSNFIVTIVFALIFFPIVRCKSKLGKNEFDFDFFEVKDDMLPFDLDDLCNNDVSNVDNSYVRDWLNKYYGERYFKNKVNSKYWITNTNFTRGLQEVDSIFHFQAGILSKSINKVSGKGFQCKKLSITRTWSVGFWGKKYKNDDIKTETLDADSCWYLVRNKKCDKEIMTCDENQNCNYEDFPPDQYSWLGESSKTFFHCYFSPKIITESDLDSHIFTGFCKVSDWSCNLRDSIVVWGKDVVHSCPFRRVLDGNFDSAGALLTDREQKLGFQFKRFENHCGLDFMLTTEGLYIAPLVKELPVLESFDSFGDTRGLMDLALADEDFRALELVNDEKEILRRECNTFVSLLKIFSLSNDKFMRITDFKNKEVIIYAAKGQIFLPRCTKIKEVNLVSMEKCFEDIPISFFLGNSLKNGYLTQDRVIRAHSRGSFCSNLPIYIKLPFLGKTIVVLNNKSEFTSTKKVKFDKLDFYDHSSFKNLTHMDSLINGLDIIGQMHNLSISNENGGEWMVISENSKEDGFGYVLTKFVDWLKDWSWFLLKNILQLLLAIAIILVLGKFCFRNLKKGYDRLRLNHRNNNMIPNILYRRNRGETGTTHQELQVPNIVVQKLLKA